MNSSKQALIYSFVAKGSVVLAEHTAFSGNFSTVAVQCLQKLPPNSTRSTYSCDGHTFNFLVDRGFGTVFFDPLRSPLLCLRPLRCGVEP
jgi:vesicle-associated membrane protein 72